MGICLVLVLIIGSIAFALNHYSSKVERVEIDRSVVTETGKEPAKEDQDLITIALLGTDYSKNEEYGNLSPSVPIQTLGYPVVRNLHPVENDKLIVR